MYMTRFWNNLHQDHSSSKDLKTKQLKVSFGTSKQKPLIKIVIYLNLKCTLEAIVLSGLLSFDVNMVNIAYTFCGFKCIQVNITIKTIKKNLIPSFLWLLYSDFASKLNENGILVILWKAFLWSTIKKKFGNKSIYMFLLLSTL